MSDHIALIRKKIDHLGRMKGYLEYSLDESLRFMPKLPLTTLSA
jgi:hypothetical protein